MHGTDPVDILGYWSPITSTVDWCELNYEVTHYVAEFVNTLTNVSFLFLGLIGIYSCYKTRAETRFYLCLLSYMLVGLGSFLFHGTLYYEMQLLDELPMMFGSSIFAYTVYYFSTLD
jgi:dihydroceramidase